MTTSASTQWNLHWGSKVWVHDPKKMGGKIRPVFFNSSWVFKYSEPHNKSFFLHEDNGWLHARVKVSCCITGVLFAKSPLRRPCGSVINTTLGLLSPQSIVRSGRKQGLIPFSILLNVSVQMKMKNWVSFNSAVTFAGAWEWAPCQSYHCGI